MIVSEHPTRRGAMTMLHGTVERLREAEAEKMAFAERARIPAQLEALDEAQRSLDDRLELLAERLGNALTPANTAEMVRGLEAMRDDVSPLAMQLGKVTVRANEALSIVQRLIERLEL